MSDIDNPVALVIEIIAAIVALVALIMMIANLAQTKSTRSTKGSVNRQNHMKLAVVLVVAAAIHGIAAMIYDSDAIAATYVFGWIGLAFMVASGVVAMPPVRKRIGSGTSKLHRALFIVGIVFVLAHIVAGRL